MMVSTMAAIPTLCDLLSGCFRYFHAYQNPKGGRNKLTEYTTICRESVSAGGLSFKGLPQWGQK